MPLIRLLFVNSFDKCYCESMADEPSRMTEAKAVQESSASASSKKEADPSESISSSVLASSASSSLDAAEYVEAVMCYQQKTSVLRIPTAVAAVGESEVKNHVLT